MNSETPQFRAHCERLIGLLPELANNVIRRTLDALRAPKGDLAVAADRQLVFGVASQIQQHQLRFHEALTHRFQTEVAQARQARPTSQDPSEEAPAKSMFSKLDELSLGSAPPPLKPGAATVMPLRGETTRLSWRDGVYPRIEQLDDRLVLTLPAPHGKATLPAARALLRSFFEAQIRRDVSRHLARYCAELERAPTGVRLRPLKSLWGSLDTRDRITLDLALALAPPAALRYVTIHELCHLRIRSHSPRFWALVESLMPDWREQREWLRLNGQALKAELTRLIQA